MGSSLNVILKTHYKHKDSTYPVCFQLTIDRKSKYEYSDYSVKEDQFREGLSDWVRRHPDAELINRNLELRRSMIMKNLMDAQAGKLPLDHKSVFAGKNLAELVLFRLIESKANYCAARESRWFDRLINIKKKSFWNAGGRIYH